MRWDFWVGSPDGRPTMFVKHLLCHFGCHLDFHKFVKADDEECFHTHPAYAIRIVLWGGYIEQMEDRSFFMWLPGMIGLVRPSLSHRIDGLLNGYVSYSLWIRFWKIAPISLRGSGWPRDIIPYGDAKLEP